MAAVLLTHTAGQHVGAGILLFASLAFLVWSLLPVFFNRKDS